MWKSNFVLLLRKNATTSIEATLRPHPSYYTPVKNNTSLYELLQTGYYYSSEQSSFSITSIMQHTEVKSFTFMKV